MRLLTLIAFLVSSFVLEAQVFDEAYQSTLTLLTGKTKKVFVTKRRSAEITYFTLDEMKNRVVPESVLKEADVKNLWQQPFKTAQNGEVTYSEVVKMDGVSKEDIYMSARLWFAEYYKSSKDVLEIDDKEDGLLVGRGWGMFKSIMIEVPFYMTTKIEVKDGKYRYTLSGFEIGNSDFMLKIEETPMFKDKIPKMSRRQKVDLMIEIQRRIFSLKHGIKFEGDDDW